MENGCFRKRGYVYSSSLKGGGSDESLSSFVLIARLEASDRMDLTVDRTKMNRALECIMANLNITDNNLNNLSPLDLSRFNFSES